MEASGTSEDLSPRSSSQRLSTAEGLVKLGSSASTALRQTPSPSHWIPAFAGMTSERDDEREG